MIARFFGARRKAYNWTLEQIKAGIDAYEATGVESKRPSLYGLRKRWNAERSAICVNTETGEVWWSEVSKPGSTENKAFETYPRLSIREKCLPTRENGG